MGAGWTLVLIAAAAFWAQPPLHNPGIASASVQAVAPASNAPPTQNNNATTETPVQAAPLPGPVQPIPFSHKQHAGTLKLPCEFCHTPSRSGETLLIPRADFCMQCHQTMGTNDPGVQKLAAYAKSDSPIPWVRVYQLPSFVSFSHKVHLAQGITCQQCHGPVAERVQLFKETDISMAGCVNCHREKKANVECNTCHILDQ